MSECYLTCQIYFINLFIILLAVLLFFFTLSIFVEFIVMFSFFIHISNFYFLFFLNHLFLCFLKVILRSIRSHINVLDMNILGPYPTPTELETLWLESSNLCFNKQSDAILMHTKV